MIFPIKILFICLGNICRSPAAEGAFLQLVKEEGLDDYFKIDSAGTSGYHDGERADPRTRDTAKRRGILLNHISRKLVYQDFLSFDLLVAMDEKNFNDTLKITKTEADQDKVVLFRQFEQNGKHKSVPDPYYGNASDFEKVQDIVEHASKSLLQYLIQKYSIR